MAIPRNVPNKLDTYSKVSLKEATHKNPKEQSAKPGEDQNLLISWILSNLAGDV